MLDLADRDIGTRKAQLAVHRGTIRVVIDSSQCSLYIAAVKLVVGRGGFTLVGCKASWSAAIYFWTKSHVPWC